MMHAMNCPSCDKLTFIIQGKLYELKHIDPYRKLSVHDMTVELDLHSCKEKQDD